MRYKVELKHFYSIFIFILFYKKKWSRNKDALNNIDLAGLEKLKNKGYHILKMYNIVMVSYSTEYNNN